MIYTIFGNKFTEVIEVIYFLMSDSKLYKLTSNDKNRISFRVGELEKDFAQDGYEISDIAVIIHGHTKYTYFSGSDIATYRLFKSEGFRGRFYIYVYRTKAIYELARRLR